MSNKQEEWTKVSKKEKQRKYEQRLREEMRKQKDTMQDGQDKTEAMARNRL